MSVRSGMKSDTASILNCALIEDEVRVARKRIGIQDAKVSGKCYNSNAYGKKS